MDIEAGDERVRASGSRSRPPLPHGGVSIRRSCCRHRYLRWPCTTRAHMRERTHSMREHILWGGPALQVHTCERIRTRCSADVRERELGVHWVFIGCSLGVHCANDRHGHGSTRGSAHVRACARACMRHVCMHACVHVCARIHACMCACMHACTCACIMHTHTCTHAHACKHACMQSRMHACMCAHAHIRVCMCVCVCVCVSAHRS